MNRVLSSIVIRVSPLLTRIVSEAIGASPRAGGLDVAPAATDAAARGTATATGAADAFAPEAKPTVLYNDGACEEACVRPIGATPEAFDAVDAFIEREIEGEEKPFALVQNCSVIKQALDSYTHSDRT